MICAWDLNLDLKRASDTSGPSSPDAKPPAPPATTFRQQVQAHTHWINDIALAQSSQALISASSDITVKVWRPAATDVGSPQTIGLHSDYVKTLAVPGPNADWVASGGLDRRICLWDLNGGGQKLSIDVGEDEAGNTLSRDKASVYALSATNSILASGGPESIVRLWDSKSGKRITKFVGHTDIIRDVLISQDGGTIMTASSDQTVKIWSVIAGRCMYTMTMHDAGVWSLFSTDSELSVFYSSDKSGLVAKTDTRGSLEPDQGLSVAVCQEHEGVHQVRAAGDYLWTATSRPSINRWRDVDTDNAELQLPETYKFHRTSVATARSRYPSPPNNYSSQSPHRTETNKKQIPLKHALRLSNTAYFPSPATLDPDAPPSAPGGRRGTQDAQSAESHVTQPFRSQPEYSIEGQNGLIKHVMLNDRKRVLTLDTAGEVLMWDLLKCVPIKSFGKRHLEDVTPEVTTTGTVANWCTVDTRTGSLAVVLEENNCFDAEMYADELELDEDIEFKEDQRINLGKWVLRYLFQSLITEEIRRDERYRKALMNAQTQARLQRENAPSSIQLPQANTNGWHPDPTAPLSATTPRATNGMMKATTPGFGIGLATPAAFSSPNRNSVGTALSPMSEEGAPLEKRMSQTSQPRMSSDRNSDYFSSSRLPNTELTTPGVPKPPVTPGEGDEGATTPVTDEASKDTPTKEGLFGKKFRMGMSFGGMKKLGKTQTNEKDKPAAVEEKDEIESDSRSSKTSNSRVVDDNFMGTIQKIRFAYEDSLQQQSQQQISQEAAGGALGQPAARIDLQTAITPSMPAETPVLKPPLNTTILIQEDRPEAGGVADLFEGTVGALGEMADLVEKAAPMWLGEVLLKNQVPLKDIVKISFILEPWQNQLPSIAADGNNRLNANRMLRAKKILAYIAERIEPAVEPGKETPDDLLKPEEYLELYCQSQVRNLRSSSARAS